MGPAELQDLRARLDLPPLPKPLPAITAAAVAAADSLFDPPKSRRPAAPPPPPPAAVGASPGAAVHSTPPPLGRRKSSISRQAVCSPCANKGAGGLMGDMNAAASPSPKAPPQHVDLTTDLTTPDGKDGGFDDVEMAQALKASLAENSAAAAGSSSKPSPASAARPAGAGPLSVQSLVDAFLSSEPREWRCERCAAARGDGDGGDGDGDGADAAKPNATARHSLLRPAPPLLLLHLKRFEHAAGGAPARKRRTVVELDETLDLSAHFPPPPAAKPAAKRRGAASAAAAEPPPPPPPAYHLHAIVTHHGYTTGHGHYTAAVREGDEWREYDDESASKLDAPPTEDERHTKGGYILMYKVNEP